MPESLARALKDDWAALFDALGVTNLGNTLVAGENAVALADALLLLGSAPVSEASSDMVLLTRERWGVHDAPTDAGSNFDPSTATAAATGLGGGTLDLVIYLRAWTDRPSMVAAVREAARVTALGGAVVLGELNAGLLSRSRGYQYPSALAYATDARTAQLLLTGSIDRLELEMEATRARLVDVVGTGADLTRAVFPTPVAYAEAVAAGLWRGTVDLPDVERGALGASAVAVVGSPPREREPWVFVRGFKRR